MDVRWIMIVHENDEAQPMRAKDDRHRYTNAMSGASSAFMPMTL